jgi:hypothetical protein
MACTTGWPRALEGRAATPEMSQTPSVWFAIQNKPRPERTVEASGNALIPASPQDAHLPPTFFPAQGAGLISNGASRLGWRRSPPSDEPGSLAACRADALRRGSPVPRHHLHQGPAAARPPPFIERNPGAPTNPSASVLRVTTTVPLAVRYCSPVEKSRLSQLNTPKHSMESFCMIPNSQPPKSQTAVSGQFKPNQACPWHESVRCRVPTACFRFIVDLAAWPRVRLTPRLASRIFI